MRRARQQGFTLIELMIVVTIVGIIVAMAVPAYLNYATRTKASEGIALFTTAKTSITEYYVSQGLFPNNNAQAGMEAPTSYRGNHVDSVTVSAGGVVTVQFNDPGLQNGTLVFTPSTIQDGPVQWTCSTAIPFHLVPKSCHN